MKVVIVDMQPITPAVGGGRLRLLGLYHDMGTDIEAAYVGTYDWPGEPERDAQITSGLREICVPLSAAHHSAAAALSQRLGDKTVIDAAFSMQARLSPAWIARARAEIRTADVVIFSHPWAYTSLQDALLPTQTVVYDSHNVESVLKATLLGREGEAAAVVREVVRNEYALTRRADLVLCCSHGDMDTFARLFDVSWHKLRLVPNGAFTQVAPLDRDHVRAEARRVLGLPADRPMAVFVGSDYGPNVEAARFIATALARDVPEVTFVVQGGAGNAIDPAIAAPNLLCTGVVDADRRDLILQASDVAVNPMSAGSGTNIKMFDFLAAGLPVVTTETGARGICDVASSPAFIKIQPLSGFAAAVRSLLVDGGQVRGEESPREYVSRLFSWERISRELGRQLERAHASRNATSRRRRGVMFTTWNVTCGIAEHASYLADSLDSCGIDVLVLGNRLAGHSQRGFERDLHFPVARPWTWDNLTWQHSGVDLDAVEAVLQREHPDFAIVQHHTAFMPTADYERLLDLLRATGMPVAVEFHNARQLDAAALASFGRRAQVLLFHDEGETHLLQSDPPAKVVVSPLPVRSAGTSSPSHSRAEGPVIGGFGFLRPYKGVLKSIRTIAMLRDAFPDIRYAGWHATYDAQSTEHLEECLAEARRLGIAERVEINTAFLPIEEVIARLSECDLVLLPYAPADEGASAAVNVALASGRVAVVSPSRIFNPVANVVHVVDEDAPEHYARAVTDLIQNPDRMQTLRDLSQAWIREHSYPAMAQRLAGLLTTDPTRTEHIAVTAAHHTLEHR
jgi:glycosyltransferase involved in cell wall biosynthesis